MNINQFKSEIRGGGARPNLYRVEMGFPAIAGGANETRKLSFLCKSAALPASTLGVIEVPFRGRFLKIPGDRQFQEWTITVINDEGFVLRNAFEKWMNAAGAHTENKGLPLSDILSDAAVFQQNRAGKDSKVYLMRGIFPTEVSQIDLAWDSNDQIEEFQVTLQVQFWESNTTS